MPLLRSLPSWSRPEPRRLIPRNSTGFGCLTEDASARASQLWNKVRGDTMSGQAPCTISAIVTTHNRAALLREAVESVLAQESFPGALEALVVDDASTDDTEEVVRAYSSVRYVRAAEESAAGARNVGIHESTGEWLAFLDDDDAWLPHKLRRCCEALAAEPDARLVFSSAIMCDATLTQRGAIWRAPVKGDPHDSSALVRGVYTPSAVMVHRSVFDRVGGFDRRAPYAEDRDMWIRVAYADIPWTAVEEPLVLYRLRQRLNGEEIYFRYRQTAHVLSRYLGIGNPRRPALLGRLRLISSVRGWYANQMVAAARQARREGRAATARRYLRIAMLISPPHSIRSLF